MASTPFSRHAGPAGSLRDQAFLAGYELGCYDVDLVDVVRSRRRPRNGLLTADFEPNLAYHAFRDAVVRVGRLVFVGATVDVDGADVQAYCFGYPDSRSFYALWSDDGASHCVAVPLSRGRVVNMCGEVQYITGDANEGRTDGRVSVQVGADPIFVEVIE